MRKLERRAILCLLCTAVLVVGLGIFIFRFVTQGSDWATYPANSHIYKNGNLATGSIYDRTGLKLAENTKDGIEYADDSGIRTATVHTVGDKNRSIANSAETVFQDKLVGYNLLTGAYSPNGRSLYLTIDAEICKAANEALAGRKGTIGVYNYKTGDIICLVSSPNFDPLYPPQLSEDDTSGTYINRFFSSAIVPGSIYKLVTSAAAIENIKGIKDWSYTCTGTYYNGNDKVTCTRAHGTQSFSDALANSCNCAYAVLSEELGGATLEQYTEDFGLNESIDINGIRTAKGSFDFPEEKNVNLCWTGIGQYHDLINPCSFLRFVGAIANGGDAAQPRIISHVKTSLGFKSGNYDTKMTGELIDEDTAKKLRKMMKHDVEKTYGESSFPGLKLYAKSGTAEVGNGEPNAWFTGFIRNKDYPYAFIVLVENGGSGSTVAGSVANTVMQAVVSSDSARSESDDDE